MHTLIVGVTESGKTTLGKRLAHLHMAQGFGVLVLTAVWEKWPSSIQTANQAEFLDAFWDSRKCFCFVDEAGETVGRYNDAMSATATRGRHWGHSCYYLVQSPTLLEPTVRKQCSQLYCFAVGKHDADLLAEEWLTDELKECPNLQVGEYFRVIRFGIDGKRTVEHGALFPPKGA